jgi:hypothetical protein
VYLTRNWGGRQPLSGELLGSLWSCGAAAQKLGDPIGVRLDGTWIYPTRLFDPNEVLDEAPGKASVEASDEPLREVPMGWRSW